MEYDSDCLSNLTTTHFGRDTLTENNIMGRISLTKPVAIFSSASNAKVMTQMPPLETLGTKHYIPAIDLTALGANGSIIATTTEDSTIIIIRGAYDKVSVIFSLTFLGVSVFAICRRCWGFVSYYVTWVYEF